MLTAALSAGLAGLVAVLVTVAIERLGGVAGGIVGTTPTTIVPAALGIWVATDDVAGFREAMGAVPVGMFANALFLATWRVLPARLPAWTLPARLAAMLTASLLVWGAAALTAVRGLSAVSSAGLPVLPVGAFALAGMVGLGAWFCRPPLPDTRGRAPVGPVTLVARGALAAAAVGAAVALADVGGPLLSGMASVFPAIFLTAMTGLWLSQGEAVPLGAVGPMILGSSSIAGFALLSAFSFPALGPALGLIAAWAGAVALLTLPAFAWLRGRRGSPVPAPNDA